MSFIGLLNVKDIVHGLRYGRVKVEHSIYSCSRPQVCYALYLLQEANSRVFCLSRYDFYIVSQSVREGTVTPTHYNVIYDTVRLQPDVVQRLTYQLCHMYYNVTVSACVGDSAFP